MKLSLYGRLAMALLASVALGLGMTACGGGTIGYIWVLGQQYNQIAGFKVDDYTGNLTATVGSPYTSNGVNPVMIVVKPGGRYVYVINQGSGGGVQTVNGVPTIVNGTSSGISVYAVGGDGSLTYQNGYQSQGSVPVWAQFDGGGTYLYVLDKYSPDANAAGCQMTPVQNCNGSITAFQVDPNTGRLQLIQNTQAILPSSTPPNYFEVGSTPLMAKTSGSCLVTLNSDNTVSPYSISSSNGQLGVTSTGSLPLGTTSATSINGNGTYIYATDSDKGVDSGRIFPFTVRGGDCTLQSVVGASVTQNGILPPGAGNPVYSFVDNSGKYLYVLNQLTANTQPSTPASSITLWTISGANGQLSSLGTATTGSGPVCMVEDTSNKYMYISNHNDGTITGKVLDPTTGLLSALTRGSTFTTSGQASCLALSGAVN